jgi:hypothetical protein
MCAFLSCRKPYEPEVIKKETHFLVVDGTIAIGNNEVTTIVLSRTKKLSDSVAFEPELNATVYIESQQGAAIAVAHTGNGIYQTTPLSLQPGVSYRLKIIALNKEYLSNYTQGRISPAIDSVTWKQDGEVTIGVHTHDPSNNTRFYRWNYIETWNYSSFLSSAWGVSNGLIFPKDSITQTDSCWRTAQSTNISVGSSVALNEDVISDFPVAIVPQHSEKISLGYSILVRQYAITDSAYRYLRLIQKNTEQLGTLFDGQPSQLKGNIQCVEDANEPVIGFITASTVTQKRIFIRNRQLTDWHFTQPGEDCDDIVVTGQDPGNYAIYTYPDPKFSIYYFVTGAMVLARKACLECTELGGTNVKPSFW